MSSGPEEAGAYNQDEFLRVRDAFFINPKDRSHDALGDALSAFLDESHRSLQTVDGAVDPAAHPLVRVARELALEFKGARVFDHRSVAQLHPSDSSLGELAHFASNHYNNNTIIGEVSPVETQYEQHAVRWLSEHIAGYDPDVAGGSIVTGGTSANLTALFVAREALQERGWDGSEPAKLFMSPMAHYSIAKAAQVLAPKGIIQPESVPLKEGAFTMDLDALREQIEAARRQNQPILGLVALAGQTETGQVEDLAALAEISAENDVFLHVDGAYGAPFRLTRRGGLFAAMSDARSITCDPHKYMYVPYACGTILFADKTDQDVLVEMNKKGEAYMYKYTKDESAPEVYSTYLGNRRIEGSMGGQAATALHKTIQHFGKSGLGALLDHNLEMAQLFAEGMREADGGLELSFDPDLNTVCLQPTGPLSEANDARIEKVSADLERKHDIYLSTTSLPLQDGAERQMRKVFRFVATHPYTEASDIEHVVESLTKEWKESANV